MQILPLPALVLVCLYGIVRKRHHPNGSCNMLYEAPTQHPKWGRDPLNTHMLTLYPEYTGAHMPNVAKKLSLRQYKYDAVVKISVIVVSGAFFFPSQIGQQQYSTCFLHSNAENHEMDPAICKSWLKKGQKLSNKLAFTCVHTFHAPFPKKIS